MSEVHKEIDGSKGRYFIQQDGQEAELTFSVLSASTIIADHTGVPEELRGTGLGHVLVERMVQDARQNGFKIVPLCPFVNAQRQKHPDWADVFQV
ncbi:GNAT family N-acetyltransferase [Pseudaestuariivita rosea]|uniref:GNAT family N-acetyltransferase n=1 Tax=Pseudaestuariivita rosea TaxID=2763263 RepID=UPI001ABA5D24|nr:GNAT family N-acetyltransferase [Pseudaestuariivita rosea]